MIRTVLLLAAMLAAAPAIATSDADERAALRWIETTGQRMATPDPSPADLAPLVAKLEGARVIGIGEVNHGTHEDQAFKAELIKALVRAGAIRVLALEANRPAGAAFDAYVRKGQNDPAEAIRSGSFFRIWKGDEFAGLLIWLRAWNLANPDGMVRVIGIDNQDAGRDSEYALAFLAKRDAALSAKLKPAFGALIPPAGGKFPNPSAWIQASKPGEHAAAMAAAKQLDELFKAKATEWGGDPEYREAAHAAQVAWQNLYEYEREVGIVDLATLPMDYMSRRDVFMAKNLIAMLRDGERAAFWAHDMHIADDVPRDYAEKGVVTVGSELEKALGDDYRTVGFTYSRASVLTMRIASTAMDLNKRTEDEAIPFANDRPQDLGGVLAKLPGDAWWFALDTKPRDAAVDRWLKVPLWRGWTGAAANPDKFQPGDENDVPFATDLAFDVLVWFRTMNPQRRWPLAAPK